LFGLLGQFFHPGRSSEVSCSKSARLRFIAGMNLSLSLSSFCCGFFNLSR
jgi:hypothetical protein